MSVQAIAKSIVCEAINRGYIPCASFGVVVGSRREVSAMRKGHICLLLIVSCIRPALAQTPGNPPSPQSLRALGAVTKIQPDGLTLHTDAGPDVNVRLAAGVTVLRVPPGATNLDAATKITLNDINPGDRVLVRGKASDDQKFLIASSVVVMSKSDLANAHEAENLDWQRRGIRGTVQSVKPEARELTMLVPTASPASGGSSHSMVVTLTANAILLRYAPGSVKFADAKPSTFEQIKVGDQVRALGTRSEDGNRFTAEKLVSGTFRTLAVTVATVDSRGRTINGTDMASGKPILVRMDADSKAIRLSPSAARILATLNSGGAQESKAAVQSGDQAPDLEQELQHAPPLDLAELKAGDSLIVVGPEGTAPSQVTAVNIFAGVEPILSARPKGSNQTVLGPWMLGSGGDSGP
jgi:hypothetical protein